MIGTPVLPLDDLVVIELGETIATAYTGKLLAELGASVIRVDALDGGALYRSDPLIGEDGTGLKVGAAWLHLNRQKQSVTCALNTAGGHEIVEQLLDRADVLIDGLGIDELNHLGFPYDTLRERFPRLVIASITPFGLSGPYRDLHGSDLVVGALGGLLNMVGFPEREPLALGGSQAQYAAGLTAFTAIMGATTFRDFSGQGQLVDISLLETVAFIEWKSGASYEATGQVRRRVGNNSHWIVLRAADGYVALVYQDQNLPALRDLTGIEELDDERFKTRSGRSRYASEITDLLAPWFESRKKHDIYREGQAVGIPLGFVATIDDLLHSPQYESREFWQELDYPATGVAVYPSAPYHLTGIELPNGRAPTPGEDTNDVLKTILNFPEELVDYYRTQEVI